MPLRVVVFDYGGNPRASEVAVVARRLRADGARRLVLLGASEGAKASLIAGQPGRTALPAVLAFLRRVMTEERRAVK